MIQQAIQQLINGQSMSAGQAEGVMDQVMSGAATPAQIAGLLIALRLKGETVDEITGCARAMRRMAVSVRPRRADLIDTCGTGGDGAGTFNISTTTAFVVAGAGLGVAKHGNRSVSSRCGSADVLTALGVHIDLTPEQAAQCIDEVGIGFLFAPKLHPAMKHAIGPRRELGVRTIFNILGPLTNPANTPAQLLGVYDAALTEPLARVLQELGARSAYVVHGAGGLDELCTAGTNQVSYFGVAGENGHVATKTIDPRNCGLPLADLSDLRGGDPRENAQITRDILSCRDRGPRRDTVLLNAAAALLVGGAADGLLPGIGKAAHSIDSGAALSKLEGLIELTQKMAA